MSTRHPQVGCGIYLDPETRQQVRQITTLPPYSRKPITLPDGTPVIGWSGPTTPTRPQRCACGRPVPASSACDCCCAEHDLTASIARHPAGKARTDGGPSLREYLESKGEL